MNAIADLFDEQKTYKDPFEKLLVDTATNVFTKCSGLDQVNQVKGETRIANNFDPAAILDGSAERYDHPNTIKYLSGGGPHDYHEGIDGFLSGFGDRNIVCQIDQELTTTQTTECHLVRQVI